MASIANAFGNPDKRYMVANDYDDNGDNRYNVIIIVIKRLKMPWVMTTKLMIHVI